MKRIIIAIAAAMALAFAGIAVAHTGQHGSCRADPDTEFGDPIVWDVHGTNGNDDCNGHTESTEDQDEMFGKDGVDSLYGLQGTDYIYGGFDQGDHDLLKGGQGADKLFGGGGPDNLWGQDQNDDLHGNNGNDWLIGGSGADLLTDQGDSGDIDKVCDGPSEEPPGQDKIQLNDGDGNDVWYRHQDGQPHTEDWNLDPGDRIDDGGCPLT